MALVVLKWHWYISNGTGGPQMTLVAPNGTVPFEDYQCHLRSTSVIWDLPVPFEIYQCHLGLPVSFVDHRCNLIFVRCILAKLHNRAINRKPHSGIWETCVIWPISNSEWQISLGPSQIALGFASGYLAGTSGYLSLLVWYCQNNPRGKPLGLFCWNDLVDPK